MIDWKFNADEVEERSFEPLPIGDYRVRIEDVQEGEGKYPYYKVTLMVNGDNRKLWYYLSFMDGDKSRITNSNLASIWDCFDIPVGELNPQKWLGKAGAVRVKHDNYNGEPQAKVSYFIKRELQDKLPPWESTGDIWTDDDFTLLDEDNGIPF